jgi:sec-independent protein translocase protein TatA
MLEDLFRPGHLLVVLAIVAILFPTKLAGLGGALGKSIRDFKKSMNEMNEPAAPRPGPTETTKTSA